MAKVIKLEKMNSWSNGHIVMEQDKQYGKVKITISWDATPASKGVRYTTWASPEEANQFYTKRIKDGFTRV